MAPIRCRHRRPDAGAVDLSRSHLPIGNLLVLERRPRADGARRRPPRQPIPGHPMSALAPTLQAFFTDRLLVQRAASANTVSGYRDTFRLLLAFASERTGKQPSQLDFADLDAPLVGAFLEHLEVDRHNSIRTRNNRLAAIHSLFGYAA